MNIVPIQNDGTNNKALYDLIFSFKIFIPEKKNHKKLNIEFWIVSTHALKIWDHLNENWSNY